jgi:hypothetical protein
MFFVPGIAVTIITFPGVIVHELAHQLFCRWFKVPVFKVVYFQAKNPAGYVLHEVPQRKWQTIMISTGPFFINTIVAALIAMPAALPIFRFNSGNIGDYLLIYLSISIGMHAFPSRGDAQSIIDVMKDASTPHWLKIIGWPIIGLIYVGSLGSFFWLDLIYGTVIAAGIPNLILWLMR